MLYEIKAPTFIDYLSVDIKGSEYEVLKEIPINRYRFGLITVEHNLTPMSGKLRELLIRNSNKRIIAVYSVFDAWCGQASEEVPQNWL